MAGIKTPAALSEDYKELTKKFAEAYNKAPATVIKNIDNTPGNSVTNLTMSAETNPVQGIADIPSRKTIEHHESLMDVQPVGIVANLNPTSEDPIMDYGTPQYKQFMSIYDSYVTDLENDMRKKPTSPHNTANGGYHLEPNVMSGEKEGIGIKIPSLWYNNKYLNKKGMPKYEDIANMTFIYNRGQGPETVFEEARIPGIDMALKHGETVTLDAFKDVGSVKIYKNNTGYLVSSWNYTIKGDIDPKTKKPKDINESGTRVYSTYKSGDELYKEWIGVLQNVAEYNKNSERVSYGIRDLMPIKDAKEVKSYILNQVSEDTPEEESTELQPTE
jgi:hypothetical protein